MLTALIVSNVVWAWLALGLLNIWLERYFGNRVSTLADYLVFILGSPIIFLCVIIKNCNKVISK